jgi:plastocyanin
LLIGLGVLVAVVIVGMVFVRAPNLGSTSSTSDTQGSPSATISNEAEAGVNEIKVSVKEFSYNPSVITVNKGERVRITLTNDGAADHNLSIQGIGITTKTIAPGQSDSTEFTPGVLGSFTFFCTVDSHKDLGLTGTLEVK